MKLPQNGFITDWCGFTLIKIAHHQHDQPKASQHKKCTLPAKVCVNETAQGGAEHWNNGHAHGDIGNARSRAGSVRCVANNRARDDHTGRGNRLDCAIHQKRFKALRIGATDGCNHKDNQRNLDNFAPTHTIGNGASKHLDKSAGAKVNTDRQTHRSRCCRKLYRHKRKTRQINIHRQRRD